MGAEPWEGACVCKGPMRTTEEFTQKTKLVAKHRLHVAFDRNGRFFCCFSEVEEREDLSVIH